jgi:hypothetical protein
MNEVLDVTLSQNKKKLKKKNSLLGMAICDL